MTVTLSADPIHKDRWLVSESEGQAPRLGAQLGGKAASELTVYWSGKVARSDMFEIIDRAAKILESTRAPVRGKFIAYGKDMRAEFKFEDHELKPPTGDSVVKFKDKSPLKTFEACRAELTGSPGTVVVWANVTGHTRGGLDKGGENIGVSVPTDLFDNAARSVIKYAIERTMGMRENAISTLLDKFSEGLLKRQRPLAR
jgi:hypothetical protein